MNIKDRMIMEEYREQKNDFARLGDTVYSMLQEIVKKAGIPVMSIAHRVKDEKSLEGKLYRKVTAIRVWVTSQTYWVPESSAISTMM